MKMQLNKIRDKMTGVEMKQQETKVGLNLKLFFYLCGNKNVLQQSKVEQDI